MKRGKRWWLSRGQPEEKKEEKKRKREGVALCRQQRRSLLPERQRWLVLDLVIQRSWQKRGQRMGLGHRYLRHSPLFSFSLSLSLSLYSLSQALLYSFHPSFLASILPSFASWLPPSPALLHSLLFSLSFLLLRQFFPSSDRYSSLRRRRIHRETECNKNW